MNREFPFGGKVRKEQKRGQRLRLQLRSSLVALRGEHGFGIGAENFADRDPAYSASECAEQERDCCQRNETEETKNERQRTIQDLANANEPARLVFVCEINL